MKVACKQNLQKNDILPPQSDRKSAMLTVPIAHQNLQNPLSKFVFLLFGPSWMCISGAIYCSICVDPVQPTFFVWFFVAFWEKCSPPSLGSMIFKAACMQNFEKLTFWPSKLIEQVPLWEHLLHLKINKNAWRNVQFLFMAPLGKLGFALCATSPTFWKVFSHFRLVLSAYTAHASSHTVPKCCRNMHSMALFPFVNRWSACIVHHNS